MANKQMTVQEAKQVLQAFFNDEFPDDDELGALQASGGIILNTGMTRKLMPVELTHFSLWPSGEEYEARRGDPKLSDDPTYREISRADAIFGAKIFRGWAKQEKCKQLAVIAGRYEKRKIGQVKAVELVEREFAKLGYLTYNSDTMFEAYLTEDNIHEAVRVLYRAGIREWPEPVDEALHDEVSREIYGVYHDPDKGWKATTEPAQGLLENLIKPNVSGGAELASEPEGDCEIMLDYEALEDYQPTSLSIAKDFQAINKDLKLGLAREVTKAIRAAKKEKGGFGLNAPFEPALVKALVKRGYLVYASDTRLEAYRFSQKVHDFVAKRAGAC